MTAKNSSQTISLPQGGGAMQGLGEKFAPEALADSSVAVTARHPNILDVFIIGADKKPYQHSWGRDTQYVPTGFSERRPPGFSFLVSWSIPGVTAFAPSARRVDLIYNLQLETIPVGIYHYRWTEADGWSDASPKLVPESKDVAPAALLASAVRTNNSFDIFVPRATGGIWTARRALDAGWSKWEPIGERSATFTATSQITTLTRSANRVLIFAIDERGRMEINGVDRRYGVIQSSWQQDGFDDDKWHSWAPVNFPPTARFAPGGHVAPVMAVGPTAGTHTLRLFTVDPNGVLRWAESSEELPARTVQTPTFSWKPDLPSGAAPFDFVITEKLTERQQLDRPGQVGAWYAQNSLVSKSITTCLEEMFYFVPLHLALQLQKSGAYLAALDWFRLVYDYNAQPAFRRLVGLPPESATATDGFTRDAQNWLLDPLNPHSIAATRRNTYPRYTLMAIIRCLLEYADSEFTRETAETIPRARELYEKALELLEFGDLKQGRSACEEVIGQLQITLKRSEWQAIGREIYETVSKVSSPSALQSIVRELNAAFAGDQSDEEKFQAVRPLLAKVAEGNARPVTYAERLTEAADMGTRLESAILSRPEVADGLATAFGAGGRYALSRITPGGNETINHVIPADGVWVPSTVSFDFCVPANPTLKALRLRAEFNLYKINNCRNITGVRRQIEFYAAPADTMRSRPAVSTQGRLILPATTQSQATVYRYAVLIERARQLVQQAMQIEAAFLAALEKSDKESYDLLTARSNVQLAQAGVRLQDLRMMEAQDGVRAAALQRDRAAIQADTYKAWVLQDMTNREKEILKYYGNLAIASAAQTILVTSIMSTATILQAVIQRMSFEASHERRMQEYSLLKKLADQDLLIAEQQTALANDRVRITEQERVIEQLKAHQAKEVLDF
ncbi:MAG TPA: hypothetical protein VM870_09445 [Pyrinomonadaceae bacterium]|nr:hypothetical protein [Pyrinomonadaceae bacterium]